MNEDCILISDRKLSYMHCLTLIKVSYSLLTAFQSPDMQFFTISTKIVITQPHFSVSDSDGDGSDTGLQDY